MIEWLTGTFFGKILMTYLVSMIPVLELRFGIPYGVSQGLPLWVSFLVSIAGNMTPIPFILLFIRKIFEWMKKSEKIKGFIEKLESHAEKKGDLVRRYKMIGLCILVAIPLPGTGGWTGALVAGMLDMRLKDAIPPILLGVIIAGIIVSTVTYGASFVFCG